MALPPRRKQRLNLQANRDGPQQVVALHFGANGVPEALEGGVEGLAAEAEDAADAAADGYGPALAVGGGPIGGEDGGAGEVPTAGEVDIHERLDEHGVHAAAAVAGERPNVVGEHPGHEGAAGEHGHGGGAGTPALGAELHVGCGGDHQRGSEAELHGAVAARHQKDGGVDVTDADHIGAAGQGPLDHGHDGAGHEQPVVVEAKGNDRLHIHHVEGAVGFRGWIHRPGRPLAGRRCIPLNRQTDQIGDGVLRLLGERSGVALASLFLEDWLGVGVRGGSGVWGWDGLGEGERTPIKISAVRRRRNLGGGQGRGSGEHRDGATGQQRPGMSPQRQGKGGQGLIWLHNSPRKGLKKGQYWRGWQPMVGRL